MTLSTLAILGVTASIVVIKLAVFAFIVALAAKTMAAKSQPARSLSPVYKVNKH